MVQNIVISNFDYFISKKSWFELPKVYNIGLLSSRIGKLEFVTKIQFLYNLQRYSE